MHHPTDRITHTTAFVTPVVEHDKKCHHIVSTLYTNNTTQSWLFLVYRNHMFGGREGVEIRPGLKSVPRCESLATAPSGLVMMHVRSLMLYETFIVNK